MSRQLRTPTRCIVTRWHSGSDPQTQLGDAVAAAPIKHRIARPVLKLQGDGPTACLRRKQYDSDSHVRRLRGKGPEANRQQMKTELQTHDVDSQGQEHTIHPCTAQTWVLKGGGGGKDNSRLHHGPHADIPLPQEGATQSKEGLVGGILER